MKQSQLYRLLSEITNSIETIGGSNTISFNDTKLGDALITTKDAIITCLGLGTPEPSNIKSVETSPELDSELQAAYDVLKHESKPCPTLLVKGLGVEKDEANQLFTELVESGKIVKGQRAEEPPKETAPEKKVTKKKVTKKKVTKKVTEKSDEKPAKEAGLMDLIGDLPKGTDLLLPKSLHALVALPETNRAEYLSGLNLKDLIDADDVARASANGVDTLLIDQVNKLTDVKVKPHKDVVEISKDGAKLAQKYFRLRGKCVKAIPLGKE